MTKREAEKLVKVWQERLRLQAWEIEVDWLDKPDEDSDGIYAAHIEWIDRRALVHLNQPSWYDKQPWCVGGIERSIVHELVHLTLAPGRDVAKNVMGIKSKAYSAWRAADEQQTSHIAACLMDAYKLP